MTRRKKVAGAEPEDAVAAAIRASAREAGNDAIEALKRLAHESKSESVQLAAIKELLDRGFGRAAAAPSESAGGVIGHVMVDDGYAN